jgi:hypothetical protein
LPGLHGLHRVHAGAARGEEGPRPGSVLLDVASSLQEPLPGPTRSEAILSEALGDEPGGFLIRAAARESQLAVLEQPHVPAQTGAPVISDFARLRPPILA